MLICDAEKFRGTLETITNPIEGEGMKTRNGGENGRRMNGWIERGKIGMGGMEEEEEAEA
jgi:hypothetical protein